MLRHDLHDRVFHEMTNLSFSCIIQGLCDEAGVLELLGISDRIPVTLTV